MLYVCTFNRYTFLEAFFFFFSSSRCACACKNENFVWVFVYFLQVSRTIFHVIDPIPMEFVVGARVEIKCVHVMDQCAIFVCMCVVEEKKESLTSG